MPDIDILTVADCIEYARACLGDSEYKPVWTSRRLDSIREAAVQLFKI